MPLLLTTQKTSAEEEAWTLQKQLVGDAIFSTVACIQKSVQNQGRTWLGQADLQGPPPPPGSLPSLPGKKGCCSNHPGPGVSAGTFWCSGELPDDPDTFGDGTFNR